ncbi:hypothetical protein Lal_00038274 [Lupinus albus]|nr:hypothetical protein Lal_00038274 [Lupinus albus]
MTRDNLYWLSHDQVALFKKFHGTASRCKQTINHVVPRIKQLSTLLYDFLLHCKNCSRIHPKIWLSVPIPKYPQYWMYVPILVPQKERERRRPKLRVNSPRLRPPTDPSSDGIERYHIRSGGVRHGTSSIKTGSMGNVCGWRGFQWSHGSTGKAHWPNKK